jgi:hypothetical protein
MAGASIISVNHLFFLFFLLLLFNTGKIGFAENKLFFFLILFVIMFSGSSYSIARK